MTKNVFDLITGIATAVDGVAGTLSVFLLSTGKISGVTASVITDVTVTLTGLVLGICSRYIKDEKTKK